MIDLTGKKSGRLTVIGRDPDKRIGRYTRPQIYWLCQCECGAIKSIRGCNLRNRQYTCTRSCGCLQKEVAAKNGKLEKQAPGIIPRKNLYYAYKRRALKILEISFEINFEDFMSMCGQNCTYCTAEPSNVIKNSKDKSDVFVYNGIDRIDSSKGYVSGNMVPCCEICNKAKRDLTTDDFFKWIENVSKNLKTMLTKPGMIHLMFAD